MRRHIRLKPASDSLCVFCAHRLAPVTSFVHTVPRTNVRIQRRGLRSSTVSSRAAEAGPSTQQQDDPFDPFGQPLPNQFVNPEEAAKANVARLREQRAEEERIRREEERIRREKRMKKQEELDSKNVFQSRPQESVPLPPADVSGVRDKHLRLKDARQRTHAAKEQSATSETTASTTERHGPNAVSQQQGRRTPNQRPDGVADQQEKAGQVRIKSDDTGGEGKRRHKARLLADAQDRESNALFNQPAVLSPQRTATVGGQSTRTDTNRNSSTGGTSLADAMGAWRSDRNGRQGDRVQNKPSSREQAIAEITENMNMKSMPRLDRERPQRQTNARTRNTRTSAFPVFGEVKPSFPSFDGATQAEDMAGKEASEWTHSDVPEVPPEMQARIDEEKRLAEERRIEEERRLEEERKAAEARKAEEERLAEERCKDAERKESERRLLEAHRRRIKQEEEARQIAETARLSAQQKEQARQAAEAARLDAQQQAQSASSQSMVDMLYGQEVSPIQQQSRASQSVQAGPPTHQPAARDEGLGGLSLSAEELDDMTEEEIDLYFKLLKKKRAKRAKAREAATSSFTGSEMSQAKSEAFGSYPPSTQAAPQSLPPRSIPSRDQPAPPQFSEAASEPDRASAPEWQPHQSGQQVQPENRGHPYSNVTADDSSMDGMSDLMRQGMLAGAAYRSAPKNQSSDLAGASSSDRQHFQRDTTLNREPPKARSSGSSSPLLPFDPALTSKWNLFKAPGRKSDPKATSPARNSDQFAPRDVEEASRRQSFPQMREGLSAERPADDPFTPVGRYDGPRKETRTCNLCGQPGHISFFCPERQVRTPHPTITENAERSRRPQPRFSKSADPNDRSSSEAVPTGARQLDAFDLLEQSQQPPRPLFRRISIGEEKSAQPDEVDGSVRDFAKPLRPALRDMEADDQPARQVRWRDEVDEDVDEEKVKPRVKARSDRFAELDEDEQEPQITLRSRKFAEPEEDDRPRKAGRRRSRDDDDDLDDDLGRRRGGRRSSMRDEDDEDDITPRHSRRRGRDDDDVLDNLSGVAKIRDKRQRERDERRTKARKEQERKLAISAKRAQAVTKITLPQFITVSNLAQALDVKLDPFIRKLESLGFTAMGHDHVLTAENASMIALEYNYDPVIGADLEVRDRDLKPRPELEDKSDLPSRPPIVTIMGHVDHGKTTILDYLRSSSVAATEHGGITQHIGAFSVNMSGGKTITFLDTPGHAAFLSMRKRGANVTDIVILVVAADDSVKPQTLEALKHARDAKVPILVAVNKVDKPEADVQRVKNDLARHGVDIEDFGGEVQVVPVSGKTGEGMDDLEEAVVTLGEILDHRAEQNGGVEGWVLEATTKAAGRVATVLVRRGTLRVGDVIVAGQTWTKVRTLKNEAGIEVPEAGPGTPVEVDGWRDQPVAGDLVLEAVSEQKATDVVSYREAISDRAKLAEDVEAINESRRLEQEKRDREKADAEAKAAGQDLAIDAVPKSASTHQEVPFIVKADVSGSAEAVVGYLQQLINPLVSPRILRSGVGPISEFDVEHAAAAKGHIISFNQPRPVDEIAGLAQHNKVRVIEQNVIYRLLEQVKTVLEEKLEPVKTQRVIGEAEVLRSFDIGVGGRRKLRIAGSRVRNGEVRRGSRVRVMREGRKVYDGTINSLKNVKKDVTEMRKGTECGIGFEEWTDAKEGDQIQTYEEIEEKRSLPI